MAVCDYPIDVHPANGPKTAGRRTARQYATLTQPRQATYGIPYRAMVPAKIDNLLVPGRALSADRMVQGSARIMPACLAMGQAAGLAAAMAVRDGVAVTRVDAADLRAALAGVGARLA